MKEYTYRFLFLLPLAAVLFVASSFTLPGDKGERIGIYQTYDDYVKGKPSAYWDNFENHGDNFNATIDGKKVKYVLWKDNLIFGYIDSEGDTYHIVPDENKHLTTRRLVMTGKLWLYIDSDFKLTIDAQKNVKIFGLKTMTSAFCFLVYIADGKDGTPVECDEKAFKKMIADDPDLVAEVKDKGIHNQQSHKWLKDGINVVDWVKRYNDKHK